MALLFFKMVVFFSLLSISRESISYINEPNGQSLPSFQDGLPEGEQSGKPDFRILPPPIPSEENPDDSRPQEGIGDAFSQDHRDRFQSKAEGRSPNEKTNKSQSGKEKPDA